MFKTRNYSRNRSRFVIFQVWILFFLYVIEVHVIAKCKILQEYCLKKLVLICIRLMSRTGRKMSRRILTCCWDSMIDVLSTVLQFSIGYNNSRKKILRKNKNYEFLLKNSFLSSLESLQKAAELTSVLGELEVSITTTLNGNLNICFQRIIQFQVCKIVVAMYFR